MCEDVIPRPTQAYERIHTNQDGEKELRGINRETNWESGNGTAQAKVGFILDAKFKRLLNSRSIKNCPVRAEDVENARVIFGPNRDRLGGATTRTRPSRVEPEYIGIPKSKYV